MTLLHYIDNNLKTLIPEFFFGFFILIHLLFGVIKDYITSFRNKILILKEISWLAMQSIFFTIILYINNPFIRYYTLLGDGYQINDYILLLKLIILASTFFSLLISLDFLKRTKRFTFEYIILIELATLGMLFLINSFDFLSLFISLELASLAFYILTSFNRASELSTEAAIKYFIIGSFASALFLLGVSGLYFLTGTVNLQTLFLFFESVNFFSVKPLLINTFLISQNFILNFSLLFILFSLLIKIAAVPFHKWLPDVYQGAPILSTLFFAVTTKVAYFGLFINIFLLTFKFLNIFWLMPILSFAIFSLLLGSVKAVIQTMFKRFIAYTTLTHIGLLLLTLTNNTVFGVYSFIFYLLFYNFTLLAFFSFLLNIYNLKLNNLYKYLAQLSGLGKNYQLKSIFLSIIFLTFAAIPPLPTFLSKIFLFSTFFRSFKTRLLVIIAGLQNIFGVIYYLRVIKLLFFVNFTVKPTILANFSQKNSLIITSLVFFFLTFWIDAEPTFELIFKMCVDLEFFLT